MKHKLFTGLVTAKPPVERAGKAVDSSLQEISGKRELLVPQDDSELAERQRDLLLRDQALTPSDMPGAYGLPSWALDTVRLARAAQHTNTFAPTDSLLNEAERKEAYDLVGKSLPPFQAAAAFTRLGIMSGGFSNQTLADLRDTDLSDWDSVIREARKLASQAEERNEQPAPNPVPKGNPGGNSQPGDDDGDDDDDGDGDGDNDSTGGNAPRNEYKSPPKNFCPSKRATDNKGYLATGPSQSKVEKLMERVLSGFDPWESEGYKPPLTAGRVTYGRLENPSAPDLLPMEPRRKRNGARRRPEIAGSFPRAMHRLALDGKIFRGAKIRGGFKGRGTVLVDLSGSMNWDKSSFNTLLHLLPECTVYGYSGNDDDRQSGRLVLLGDRGRCAKVAAVHEWVLDKGQNIIDGPVLTFLAKMTKPRIWISDGIVTGKGGMRTQNLINEANALMLAGNITRANNVNEALDIMLKR